MNYKSASFSLTQSYKKLAFLEDKAIAEKSRDNSSDNYLLI